MRALGPLERTTYGCNPHASNETFSNRQEKETIKTKKNYKVHWKIKAMARFVQRRLKGSQRVIQLKKLRTSLYYFFHNVGYLVYLLIKGIYIYIHITSRAA